VYAYPARRQSIIYQTQGGVEPYAQYLDDLRDRQAAAKIKVRVMRAELGNLGQHRTVGHGVLELKINEGPGYRVYVALYGSEWIVLLLAGDKSTQEKDIQRAHTYWKDYRSQK